MVQQTCLFLKFSLFLIGTVIYLKINWILFIFFLLSISKVLVRKLNLTTPIIDTHKCI